MKSKWKTIVVVAIAACLGLLVALRLKSLAPSPLPRATLTPTVAPQVELKTYDLPSSLVRVVRIPPAGVGETGAALSPGVESVAEFARRVGAVAAINGGFFDPNNQKSTSYVAINGEIAADPAKNERLTQNPELKPYLPQILQRSEWRRYSCGGAVRYAIVPHRELPPQGCQLTDALGAGPRLLPEITAEAEAFVSPQRDPLGIHRGNARSAIAILKDGSLMLAIAAQKPGNAASGLSLPEFSAFLRDLGAVSALNLDGGSSTALYYQGETFYGKRDEAGNEVKRPVKSIIWSSRW